jgi:hypothetical protein
MMTDQHEGDDEQTMPPAVGVGELEEQSDAEVVDLLDSDIFIDPITGLNPQQ